MVMYACGLLFLSEPCGVLVEPVHEGLDSLDGERWRGRGSRAEVTSTRRPVPRPAGSGILRSAVLVAVDPSPASAASSGARNSRICAVRGHLPTAVAPQSRLVVTSPHERCRSSNASSGSRRPSAVDQARWPNSSMRRGGGTRGSRPPHSSRWMTASATRQGLSSSRSVSSTTSRPEPLQLAC